MKKLVEFLFECLHLKDIKREGWRYAGIQFPESVAEHTLHAAQIGFILAQLEGANPQKVASIILWHDLAEVRLGDIHWLGAKYVPEKKHIEERIMKDQTGELPMQESILSLVSEYNMLSTIEGKVAKDADILDQAYQCKTYLEQGHSLMATYLGNFADRLHTESAKKMYQEILISNSHEWLLHHERRGYAKN